MIIQGLVSIIIPVFNRSGMLLEAVNSVLKQTYRPIEIIISDDGSTDETVQLIQDLINQFPEEVKSVRNNNRGPGPAREAGRKIASGEYIQYLDSDDILLPNKFEVQIKALEGKPEAGIAYGITRLVDMEGTVLAEPFKWTGERKEQLFPGLLIDRWWCTHTPLYRRTVCDKIGSWSDLRYSQDWEYDARIGALQTGLTWCDVLVSEHRTHGDARQTGSGKWLAPKDRVRFFKSLYNCAFLAGVDQKAPEMRHFSRWVFYHSRACALSGNSTAAKECFDLAGQAAGYFSRDMKLFKILSSSLGWKNASLLSSKMDQIVKRKPGKYTLQQSWMEKSDD